MRVLSYVRLGLGTLIVATAAFAGCSGGNTPSTTDTSSSSTTTNGGGTSNSGGTTATSSPSSTGGGGTSASTGATGSTTGTSGASSTSTATGDGGSNICSSTLKDKITTCVVGTDPSCLKGCGPDLPAGSPAPGNLGTKTCTCQTGVYQCAACVYESPLPTCYQPSATPPACAAGVADKAACTTPCSTGTGNDVCTMTTDAGKIAGCVCVAVSSGNIWTCATQWW